MSTSTLSTVISTFKSLGLTGQNLATAVQTVVSNSPASTIESYCATILQNSTNPSVIADMANKIAETANLPVAVANLLPALNGAAKNAATDPMAVMQVVEGIEAALGPSNGLGLNLGSLL